MVCIFSGEFRDIRCRLDHFTASNGGHEMHDRVPVRIDHHHCLTFLWLGDILFCFALYAWHPERVAHSIGIQTGHHSRRHPR